LAGTDFNVTAQTTLTFTTAPANGVGIDVYFLGLELSIPTPADATVAKAKITTTLINEHVDTTITAADSILFSDSTDSNTNKKDTVQGILDLAVHTGNVAFPATQVPSADANTLDDYEEGTWTPVLEGRTTSGTYVYDTLRTAGHYVKIGKLVSIIGVFRVSSVSAAGTGDATVTGLPFSAGVLAPSWNRVVGSLLKQSGYSGTTALSCSYGVGPLLELNTQEATVQTPIPVTDADLAYSIYTFAITYYV
jgi:hypothetical protein